MRTSTNMLTFGQLSLLVCEFFFFIVLVATMHEIYIYIYIYIFVGLSLFVQYVC